MPTLDQVRTRFNRVIEPIAQPLMSTFIAGFWRSRPGGHYDVCQVVTEWHEGAWHTDTLTGWSRQARACSDAEGRGSWRRFQTVAEEAHVTRDKALLHARTVVAGFLEDNWNLGPGSHGMLTGSVVARLPVSEAGL